MQICGEAVGDPRIAESFLKCKECGHKLEHETKADWLRNGVWVPTSQADLKESLGYQLNQLYSSTVKPSEIVTAHFRGFTDEACQQEFFNSKLGLPFVGSGSQVTDAMIDACVRDYTHNSPRPGYGKRRIITMGVDQGKVNFATVVEWFLDQNQMIGDVNMKAKAKLLFTQKFAESEFDSALDGLMREWQVLACVIDADPSPMEARRFARRFPGFVWLCRYRRGQTAREIAITEEEEKAPLATVDRTNWISAALSRFMCNPPRIEIPRDIGFEFREHIKSLVKCFKRDGKTNNSYSTYLNVGNDHFAHSLVYNELALPFCCSLQSGEDIRKFI
jgi:hypothetical protein